MIFIGLVIIEIEFIYIIMINFSGGRDKLVDVDVGIRKFDYSEYFLVNEFDVWIVLVKNYVLCVFV